MRQENIENAFIVLKSWVSNKRSFSKCIAQGQYYLHFPLVLMRGVDVKDAQQSYSPGIH